MACAYRLSDSAADDHHLVILVQHPADLADSGRRSGDVCRVSSGLGVGLADVVEELDVDKLAFHGLRSVQALQLARAPDARKAPRSTRLRANRGA